MNEPSPLVQHYAAVLRYYLFTLQGQQQLQHWMPYLCVAVVLFLVVPAVLWRTLRPTPRHRGQYVRGTRLVTARGAWFKRGFRSPKKLVIGGVGWPRKLEPLHLLVSGAPGTGKSQTIQGMLNTMGGRGDRAIVTDVGGEALSRFGQGGDQLLNPLDRRSCAWSPFAEIESVADTDRLAKSMIPDQEGREREWTVYSQTLVSAVLRRLWEQRERGAATNESLLHALTLAPPAELKALVEGLPAQALFHEGAEKMLASVRGIVGSHVAPYSHLPKEAGHKSWSIRRHVREGKGWLWLPYSEKQSAALRPLIAAWLGEAVNAILSLPPDLQRRYWVLLDEVGSIGCVQGLIDALTKGRKYGLCAILGLQSIAQLRAAFGDDGAQTLLSCLSSQLILRVNDPETAEYASSHLGDCEVVRESVARGKGEETRTKQHHVERLVLPSEIQGLKNRRGYLRLAEHDRVQRVKIPLIKRKPVIAAFEPRQPSQNQPPPPPSTSKRPVPPRPALDADAILRPREP
jgi:type IV secretory pathway TraG/TraD family ATPase VirD4